MRRPRRRPRRRFPDRTRLLQPHPSHPLPRLHVPTDGPPLPEHLLRMGLVLFDKFL